MRRQEQHRSFEKKATRSTKTGPTQTELKKFLGSIHSLHKYLIALAESWASLKSLLGRKNEYTKTADCQEVFKKSKLNSEGWIPILSASRYLIDAEKRYSTNELEMLAVVMGAEYFRNYVIARKIQVVTDLKALVLLLNRNNKKNKSMFSLLTRWLDRLIPFDFEVDHNQGRNLDQRTIYQDTRTAKQNPYQSTTVNLLSLKIDIRAPSDTTSISQSARQWKPQ